MLRTYFTYFLVFIPSFAFTSTEDRICFDLHGPTCAPGELSDPTGKSRAQNYTIFDRHEFEKSINLEIASQVDKTLEDSKNRKFYEVAAEAFSVDGLPECTEIQNLDCKKRVSEALKNQLRQEIFYNDFVSKSEFKIQDLTSISYLSEHQVMAKLRGNLQTSADRYLNNHKVMDKIKNEVFPNVQGLLVEWLKEVLPPGKARDNLIFKVDHIEFKGFDCTNDEINVPRDLEPGGTYLSVGNAVTYCKGSLHYTDSLFAIVRTLAHELSHSIDPCYIQFYLEKRKFKYSGTSQIDMEREYPFKNIISCLRDKRSAEAKRLNPPSPASNSYYTPISGGAGVVPPSQPPQAGAPQFDFCNIQNNGVVTNGDQIGEVMCDWVAAEILPRYIEKYYTNLTTQDFRLGYLNSFRHWCYPQKQRNNDEFTTHPSFEKRANSILLANPKIREQMGCSKDLPGTLYCDPKMITKPDNTVLPFQEAISNTEKGIK